MLEHGGRVTWASRQYGIPVEEWIDLSTGINPAGYPVPDIPAKAWHRLPDEGHGLQRAACDYYGVDALLAVPGSQAAIQTLPRLRALSRVTLASLTYNEHAHAWTRRGHAVHTVSPHEFPGRVRDSDVLVVCNPNNPTGDRVAVSQLLEWHAELASRGGWLVIDEAYMDVTPEQSLASFCGCPGLIVLRSLGKFFGLAGARVGFVLADALLLRALEAEQGPWAVAGPAGFAAQAALSDSAWQGAAREALVRSSAHLNGLLASFGIMATGTALFQWWRDSRAGELHEALARHAILTRPFQQREQESIRFGLPGTDAEWKRLEQALAAWRSEWGRGTSTTGHKREPEADTARG